MRGEVVTPWARVTDQDTGEPSNVPLLWTVVPHGKMTDRTGQLAINLLPDPNLLIVEWEAGPEDFAAIATDERFLVLWSDA